jgi:uncharacterized protein YciI
VAYYAVTRERGRSWVASLAMREQERWDEHAAFMDALVEDGFIILGGPLGDGRMTLLIVEAESEHDVEARLADDPWTAMDVLRIAKIEPWEILLGR